jgi:hypothetical protein
MYISEKEKKEQAIVLELAQLYASLQYQMVINQ